MEEGREEPLAKEDLRDDLEKEEKIRRVKLRGAVLGYFANRLAPAYNAERDRVQRQEGTIAAIDEFYKSRFGRVMTSVLNTFAGKSELPESVEINLSEEDIDVILEKVGEPSVYKDRLIYKMHKEDLETGFKRGKEVSRRS